MTQELLGIAKAITDKPKRNKPSILVIHSDKKFSKKHAVSRNPGTYKFSSSGVEREYLNPSSFDYVDIEEELDEESISYESNDYSFYYGGNDTGFLRIEAANPQARFAHFDMFAQQVGSVNKNDELKARNIYNSILRKQNAHVACECGCSDERFLDRLHQYSSGIFTMYQPKSISALTTHNVSLLKSAEVFFDIVIVAMSHEKLKFYTFVVDTYRLDDITPVNIFCLTRKRNKPLVSYDIFSEASKSRSYLIRLTSDPRDVTQAYARANDSSAFPRLFLYEEKANKGSKETKRTADASVFAGMLREHIAEAFIAVSKGNSVPELEGVEPFTSWRSPVRKEWSTKATGTTVGSSVLAMLSIHLGVQEIIDIGTLWMMLSGSSITAVSSMVLSYQSERQSDDSIIDTVDNLKTKEIEGRQEGYGESDFDKMMSDKEYVMHLVEELYEEKNENWHNEIIAEILKTDTDLEYYDMYEGFLSLDSASLDSTVLSGSTLMESQASSRSPDSSVTIQKVERLQERWAAYELDPILLLEYPLMSDASCPETAAFLHSYENLTFALESYLNDTGTTLSELESRLEEAEKAFIVAENNAKKVRKSYLTAEQRKSLATARQLALMALDEEASPNERISAWKKANDYLEGIMILPDAPVRGLLEAAV